MLLCGWKRTLTIILLDKKEPFQKICGNKVQEFLLNVSNSVRKTEIQF